MAWSKANSTTGNTKGVDLSKWNPSSSINWSTLKNTDGIQFIYARATYGTSTVDSEVQNHITNAKAQGLPIGFYHYEVMATGTSYSLSDADNQAKFFADTITQKMQAAGYSGYGDLIPVLDLESPNPDNPGAANVTVEQIMNWADEFCKYFKNYTGRAIMVYTSKYFYDQFGITPTLNTLSKYPLWDAEYYQYGTISNDTPNAYGGWNNWTVWQYSQTGTVQAYSGSMDLDWGPSDLAWLKPPSSTTGLSASQNGSLVTLNWTANTEVDIAGYNVYNGSTWVAYVTINSYQFQGLTPGTYTFHVQPVDQYGDVATWTAVTITVTLAWTKANATTGNIKGIDISKWNVSSSINWSTLKSADNIGFVYARATYGHTGVDSEVSNHIVNAKKFGLPIGFYHFENMYTGSNGGSYSLTDADNCAKFFADTVLQKMQAAGYTGYGDLMPVLDLENPDPNNPAAAGITNQQICDWAKEFMTYFKSYTGRSIMLYTSKYFFDQFAITPAIAAELNAYPLWTAEYYESNPLPNDTPDFYGGWNNWLMWQYTGIGTISSYSGQIDLDWGPKDLAWLTPPASPVGLTATQQDLSVVLQWQSNIEPDIAGYNIYNGSTWLANVTPTTLNYTVTGLSPGTYTLHVQAQDQYGDVSHWASATITVVSLQLQLLIHGVDYSKFIDLESVSVDNNIIMTSDTATFTMYLNGELPRPRAGQEFIWQGIDRSNGSTTVREFGGVIVNVQEDTDGTTQVYTVTAKSYDHWFNRHLVVAWYNQANADSIVKQIVQQFCPGFTTNNIQSCPAQVIPQYFNYSTPSDAIKNIADQLEWGFYVDYYKDVHFYPAESFDSPLPSGILDIENDMTSYGDLQLIENGEQVFNRIFLRGFKTRSSSAMNLTFLGDGSTTQWSIGYRASSVSGDVKVAVYPSLAAYQADTTFQSTGALGAGSQGTLLTIKKDIVDGAPDQQGASGTAYIHWTQHLLRVPNWNGSGTPASGVCIAIHFYYMKDVVYMGQDLTAQNDIAAIEGTDGIYEYSHEDKSLTNSTLTAPQAKAQLLIMKYGKPQMQGSFTSFLSGWRAGQVFTLNSTTRMGGISNKKMYVQRATKRLINNIDGNYTVQVSIEFADSPYLV